MNGVIPAQCRCCRQVVEVLVNVDDYNQWQGGKLVQDAFPYLSADEREILISGTCGSCFDAKRGRIMYSVRFHLGKGIHFRQWQIKRNGCSPVYYHPDNASLLLVNCKLVNKVNKARSVHQAGVKDVSGWIDCEDITVLDNFPVDNLERLFYNPIVDPYWRRDSDGGSLVWDGSEYASLITDGRRVYILEENLSETLV